MPSLKVAAAALRKTTERLAREVVDPSDSPPDWTAFEWAIARSAAAMQGVTALLANRLSWSGPPLWQSFMAEQKEQSLLRHSRISELLALIESAVRDANIVAVALKGASLRKLDLYLAGERPMGDIDLLVRPDDLPSVEIVLRKLDYVPAYTTRRHRVFEPRNKLAPSSFAEHADHPLNVEIHTVVAEPLPFSKVDITSCLWQPQAMPGLSAYPSVSELMLHLALHCAGNMRAHALRQIQFHDIATLGRKFAEDDWSRLLMEPGTRSSRWWLYPPLALAERYYAGSIPEGVLRESREACPVALRIATDRETLTNVSWSNLRIYAFPGVAWARTPLEALRFIRSRVSPSRAALNDMRVGRQSQSRPDPVPWYRISHGRRIWRWLFSNPPRVQTMASLRAALDTANNFRH